MHCIKKHAIGVALSSFKDEKLIISLPPEPPAGATRRSLLSTPPRSFSNILQERARAAPQGPLTISQEPPSNLLETQTDLA